MFTKIHNAFHDWFFGNQNKDVSTKTPLEVYNLLKDRSTNDLVLRIKERKRAILEFLDDRNRITIDKNFLELCFALDQAVYERLEQLENEVDSLYREKAYNQ